MTIHSDATHPLLRWAVLKHITADDTHWDLLLEPAPGDKLLTWRIGKPPAEWLSGPSTLPALRIADHRAIYLTYEGEISGGRGRVEREASGTWRPAEIAADRVSGQLTRELSITLAQKHNDEWTLTIQAV